jgi:hypothetical protein
MRRRKTGGRGGRIQDRKGLKPRSAPKATRHHSSVASEEETNAAQFRRARDEALARLAATDFNKRVKELLKLGPRETGSPPHARFIDQIAREIESLGLPVHRDSYRFNRWSLSDPSSDCELKVAGQNVLVASAYPYSGVTGLEGVTGRLKLAGCFPWNMDGKIAVFDVPYPKVPIRLLVNDLKQLGDGYFPKTIAHPVLAATAFGPDLAAAKAAGAIGAVAVWRRDAAWSKDGNITRELAADQYVPFIFPYRDIPAVWVAGEKEGEQLLEDARRGAVATLKLNALLSPDTLTDTVWTVVKGEITNESILVVTHTDGVNVVEENGPIGVLELARMFADGPEPKRTLVFVFVTGHLRIPAVTSYGQATTAWLTAHPEWWSGKNGAPRAVAGLVIEHLGASAADGIPELAYTTNSTMRSVLEKWEKANRIKRLAVIARPRLLEIGEGEPLYQHGIPAISLASVPNYLLAGRKANFVDPELMHEQIITFAEALLSLEIKSANEIGRIKRATLLKTLSAWLRLALFIGRDKTLRSHVLHAACFKLTSWTICASRRLVRWSKEQLRLE